MATHRAMPMAGAGSPDRAILAERANRMTEMLRQHGLLPVLGRRVLEVGCGTGGVLAWLRELGARPDRLYGIDLDRERVRQARARYPFLSVLCGDGLHLPFRDASFDLVVSYTLFSSLLREDARSTAAGEIVRVLAPGGSVLWYDMRVGNPLNASVRGVRYRELARLFDGCQIDQRTVTLAPPLARRIERVVPELYSILVKVPWLRTHRIGLVTREDRKG